MTTDLSIKNSPPFLLKALAQIFSFVFHPLFVSLYVVFFIAFIHPSYFAGFSHADKKNTLLIVVLNTIFFPSIVILLLKALGFINTIFLHTQKDRIVPYMATSIFIFWTYTVFKEQARYPTIVSAFIFGVFLAASGALLANIYFKISMHAIGMGGLVGIGVIIMQSNTILMTWPLCVALLVAGLVCTSRLIVSNHTSKDIYTGLAVGFLGQIIASFIVL
jgi:hypothetical protein